MKLPIYQVDAFASRTFEGNPAAICLLDAWLEDALMQSIAMENNLSETAFLVPAERDQYHIRWFTPQEEVDLCGHATLASAHLLFELGRIESDQVTFHSRSGDLPVERCDQGELIMNFPAQTIEPCEPPALLIQGLGVKPIRVFESMDYMAVLEDQDTLTALRPDFGALTQLDRRGVVVTAPGKDYDFVSRFFAPKHNIPEDPVTGSAHCIIAPYWAKQLDRTVLTARQLSRRGGSLECEVQGERVLLKGKAQTYLRGEITV